MVYHYVAERTEWDEVANTACMSRELGLSVAAVESAIEQLIQEGFVERWGRSSTVALVEMG